MSEKTTKPKSKVKSKPKTKATSSKKTSKTASKSKAASKPKTSKTTRTKTAPKTSKRTSKPKAKSKTATKAAAKKPRTAKTPKKKIAAKRKPKPPVAKPKSAKPRRLPLEQPVKGVLMNFQRGTVRQYQQHGLIQLEGVRTIAEAAPFIGRTVILHISEETKKQGRVVALHGRNGVLRVRFKQSLASEALAKEVMVF